MLKIVSCPALVALLTCAMPALQAHALEKQYITDVKKAEKVSGWDGLLKLGATINLTASDSVVGQTDGTMFNLGLNVDGQLDYLRGNHEWRNTATLVEAFSRTPALDRFVKSADRLHLDSVYLYHPAPLPWVGPYGRLGAETPLLAGRDIRAESTTFVVTQRDGNIRTLQDDTLDLTDSLRPFILRESAGVFAKALTSKPISIEFRAGIGSQQVFADDQLALDDDSGTDSIEAKELVTYTRAGGEAGLYLEGALSAEKVTYKAWAETLIPFYQSDSQEERDLIDLTSAELGARLSFKLVSWASLEYEFRAVRQPQIVDVWQIQNTLLLSFSLTLFAEPEVKKPVCPECPECPPVEVQPTAGAGQSGPAEDAAAPAPAAIQPIEGSEPATPENVAPAAAAGEGEPSVEEPEVD